MNKRNYKWYELIKDVKEQLVNNSAVEIENDVYRCGIGDNGTSYEVEEFLTRQFNRGNSSIMLFEFPFDDGSKKYRLVVNDNNTGDDNYKFGVLTVCVNDEKISIGREYAFLKNDDNKPMKINEILSFIENTLNKINVLNEIDKFIDKDVNKRNLIKTYLRAKNIDITGNETPEQIKEITEKGLSLVEIREDNLFTKIAQDHFNCKDEKLLDILKFSLGYDGKRAFLSYCKSNGLLDDYIVLNDRYYKVA